LHPLLHVEQVLSMESSCPGVFVTLEAVVDVTTVP